MYIIKTSRKCRITIDREWWGGIAALFFFLYATANKSLFSKNNFLSYVVILIFINIKM